MSNEKRFSIQIDAVSNGYMVRPAYDPRCDRAPALDETRVFESFESLTQYLNAYLPIYPVFLVQPTIQAPPPKRKR